jgi:PGF-pre-PGF domain-containing protein
LKGEAVSISLTTSSSSSSGGSSGGSSSSKSSGGGGGGGATSVEDLANVAMKDVNNQYLRINTNVTYEFTRPGNDILSVSFYSLKNSGEITSTIEGLNNRSKLVNTNPEGLVCKYINIWVGKAGFATSNNIKDARVKFKVNNSWMQEMGITTDDIKLQRYNGTAWEVLPTTLENNTTS